MPTEGLQQEICKKDGPTETPPKRSHEAKKPSMRLLQQIFCEKGYPSKASRTSLLHVLLFSDFNFRHMEDGCSKRFDIETVDFRPQSYGSNDHNSMRVPPRSTDNQSRQASYSSSSHYTPPPGNQASHGPLGNALTSSSGAFLERQEYLAAAGGGSQEPVWTS